MEPRTGRATPHPKSLAVGALLTVLVALGQISNSVYIPSMPALVLAFDTDMARVNLTFTVFLAGFAVSQIVYGPLSDRFGRRRVLLGGLVLYFVASVGCAVSSTIEALIAARFAQAVGACAGPVMAYAIVRDVYERERAARVLAYIGVAFAISPAIMPIIGGYLQAWFGWRANFLFLSAVAGSVLLAVWLMLGETIAQPDPRATRPGQIARTFVMLLRSREFLGYMLSVAFIFAGLMAYTASSAFLFIDTLGLSPERFGILAVFNVVGFLAGTLNGAAFGSDVVHIGEDPNSVTNTGQFIMAIDVAHFLEPSIFKGNVDRISREMTGSAKLPGVSEVRMPGTNSWRIYQDRMANGIPITAPLLENLNRVAGELGIEGL